MAHSMAYTSDESHATYSYSPDGPNQREKYGRSARHYNEPIFKKTKLY
jgi:hypothetical protein